MPATTTNLDLGLFRGYEVARGAYDEVFAAPGELRPAWRSFLEAASGLRAAEYLRRWEQAQRLLRQNSLAYPDPRDPAARRHPWELDGLPLIITAPEWRALEAALDERATLLDLTLQDLYGPQTLVRRGVLPAEVVFRHPGFRLPYCRNQHAVDAATEAASSAGLRNPTLLPTGRMLHFYAADLARAPDGRWWVLGDRCESGSGAGFTLENRLALSQMLPDAFRHLRVERLASYFIALKEHLASLAPEAEGRVVLLSQAAGSTNYFEDAFLARYLGLTLAEAGDLAVRANRLYLKTLAGLSSVNVLWRRPNSEHLDPLETSDAAARGVAGLLQAARSGNVALANAPGSGLVESPVFRAFMPQLAQAFLGRPLAMPGVASWWCGDSNSLQYVLEHLDDLVVAPAYRRRGEPRTLASRLAAMPHDELAARLQSDPGGYVAQERIVRSMAPAWAGDQFRQSYIALRTFAVARGNGYAVMRGGLARVSASLAPLELSLLEGERSKDTWVLAESTVRPISLLTAPDEPLELRRGGVDLSSRAAEHFFWMGRHSVRAELLAKQLRAVARRLTSEEDAERIPELPHLFRLLAEQGQIEPGYVVSEIRRRLPALEKQLPQSAFDEAAPGALRATVTALAGLAATVRDLMSLDSWRVIRQMDEGFRPTAGRDSFLDLLDKIDGLLIHLAAYAGLIAESMTRTYAWRFLDLGRRLERALQKSVLVRGMLGQGGASEPEALQALLEISDSLMTYRSRYASRFQLGAVLDLMMCDETNPRSIAYQLVQCEKHVDLLPLAGTGPAGQADLGLAATLLRLVRAADVVEISEQYEAGDWQPLEAVLDRLDTMLPKLSEIISHRFFFHAVEQHRFLEIESRQP